MSTYADMMTPVVDTAVVLIEAARDVSVKAVETIRGAVPSWMPEAPVTLTNWIDLEDLINVSFDATERVLRAQREASIEMAKAVTIKSRVHDVPVVKAA